MFSRLFRTPNDGTLTILRLVLGFVFLAHGAQKVLGWYGGPGFSGTMGMFQSMGIPPIFAYLAIAAEFLGGLGLIVGFLGRIAAFGIMCNMAVAVLTVHLKNGLFMNWAGNQPGEGFEFHLLALAIGLTLLVRGSGALSIDYLISHPRTTRVKGFGERAA
jgi:putative oxidoreductase